MGAEGSRAGAIAAAERCDRQAHIFGDPVNDLPRPNAD